MQMYQTIIMIIDIHVHDRYKFVRMVLKITTHPHIAIWATICYFTHTFKNEVPVGFMSVVV